MRCPLECPYLQESRKHAAPTPISPQSLPNSDIQITEQFVSDHEPLLLWLMISLLKAALKWPEVVDNDLKAALGALIRTYRTMQSGLVYDSRPDNLIAAAVFEHVRNAVEEFRDESFKRTGMRNVRDRDVLGALAFLERLEMRFNNGRRLGRAFIDHLRESLPSGPPEVEAAPGLIL